MDTGKVGILLGALALGGVVMLYLEVDRLGDLVRSDSRRQRFAAPLEAQAVPDAAPFPRRRAASAGKAADAVKSNGVSLADGSVQFFSTTELVSFASNMDQLKGALQLTPEQVEQVKDVVERTRRRIEDVVRTPARDGVSPRVAIEERARAAELALEQVPKGSLNVSVQPVDFFQWPLPGRDTTYGEEITLIGAEARREIEALLDRTQRKLMKQVQLGGLFHEVQQPWISVDSIRVFTK